MWEKNFILEEIFLKGNPTQFFIPNEILDNVISIFQVESSPEMFSVKQVEWEHGVGIS